MKAIMFAIAMSLPTVSHAADGGNLLAGVYSDCVQWTTENGMPTSKKFKFSFAENDSMKLAFSFFEGSAACDGTATAVHEYNKFTMIDDTGNRPVRLMTAQDQDSKVYFKFVVSHDYAAIYSGNTLPIQVGMDNFLSLTRVK